MQQFHLAWPFPSCHSDGFEFEHADCGVPNLFSRTLLLAFQEIFDMFDNGPRGTHPKVFSNRSMIDLGRSIPKVFQASFTCEDDVAGITTGILVHFIQDSDLANLVLNDLPCLLTTVIP